jgi:undecaprenyl-diphosphatase
MRRYVRHFDRTIISAIIKLPDWIRPTMLFMTLLGQPPITVGVAAGVIGYGLARDNAMLVINGCIAIITFAASSLLKPFLRRARPDNDYVRNMIIQTFSFPSGHAAGSLVSFGLVACIVSWSWPTWTIPAIAVTGCVCSLIGVSRVYLGAHYPSDVIGGWIVGGLGLLVIILSRIAL